MQSQQNEHVDPSAGAAPRRRASPLLDEGLPLSQKLHGILPGLAKGLAAWVLCQAPLLFSVNPLGPALLCAVDQQVGWVLVGALFGLWQGGHHTLWYAGSTLLALVLRLFCRLFLTAAKEGGLSPRQLRRLCLAHLRQQCRDLCHRGGALMRDDTVPAQQAPLPPLPPLFDEPISLRVMSALLSALVPALAIPISGGFVVYDLFGSVFYLLLAPLATALFAMTLASHQAIDALAPRWHAGAAIWRGIGGAVLLMSLCFCGRSLSFIGISPVVILSVLLIVPGVRRLGLAGGVAVSLLCGLAYEPLIIPMYLCLALPYALLYTAMGGLALLPAALFAYLYLLLVGGMPMFLAIAPSLTVGVILMRVLFRLQDKLEASRDGTARDGRLLSPDSTLRLLLDEQENTAALAAHLSAVAGSFSSLGEVFRQCAETMQRPGHNELRHLCDEVYDDYCPECPNKDVCWNEEYTDTVGGIYALSRTLASDKKAIEECLSPALRGRCPHTKTILGEINYRVSRRTFELTHGAQNEQFAMSCDAISHLLRDILRRQKENALPSGEDDTEEKVARYLVEKNIPVRHVYLRGSGQKELKLLGLTPSALTLPKEEFRADLARILASPVSKLHYDRSEDGTISLTTLPNLRVDYVHRSVAAETGGTRQSKRTVCGDTIRLFEGDGGMFYALLCDGMGSGRSAALTSGICAVFLERVLRTGVGVRTALRLLNQYLLSRHGGEGEECTSTVDLFELDLYRGQARFIKSGAAASLILRDGRLFRLSSHTVPIGILQAIDAQVIPFEVQPGDHILLMSDGVTDSAEQGGETNSDWLSDYLSSVMSNNGSITLDDSALIDAIFSHARAHGSCDDMSVISIRIADDQAMSP